MSERLAHLTDINFGFEQFNRERVTETVRELAVRRNLCFLKDLAIPLVKVGDSGLWRTRAGPEEILRVAILTVSNSLPSQDGIALLMCIPVLRRSVATR